MKAFVSIRFFHMLYRVVKVQRNRHSTAGEILLNHAKVALPEVTGATFKVRLLDSCSSNVVEMNDMKWYRRHQSPVTPTAQGHF